MPSVLQESLAPIGSVLSDPLDAIAVLAIMACSRLVVSQPIFVQIQELVHSDELAFIWRVLK